MSDLRYPLGPFKMEENLSPQRRNELIAAIAGAPAKLRAAVEGLNDAQLDAPYREGGWTVRQVVHHVVDSHMNAYIRLKWTLTENEPTIKAYEEKLWAELPEARTAPVEISLALLEALHRRWILQWQALKPEDFSRNLRHPEYGLRSIDWLLQLYAWHGQHHTAHITSLRTRMGWS
jgi:uncharacterized damage-inducible protein DinB